MTHVVSINGSAWTKCHQLIYRLGFAVLLCLLLGGCADSRYYWQSLSGHLQLMQAAHPIDIWLANPQSTEALKQRLRLAQDMRRFAVTALNLPDNASYQRYANVERRYVVWNVVAAPAFSLTLKTWCFPLAGCVGYRGYFSEAAAQALARDLRSQGLETSVYGVPAYSTLGLMNWFGGDPLLNTFIDFPEGELARLLFHELSHQVLYVADDTVFNESFATAVERLGATAWLNSKASASARADYVVFDKRRQQLRALTQATRQRLVKIYSQNEHLTQVSPLSVAIKNEAMKDFRSAYARLKLSWGGYAGYDTWVAQANNAALGAQAAYDELVPGFEALFAAQGQSWPHFYDAVRQLAKLPKTERIRQLTSPVAKQPASQHHG